jgi:hypothetical protein
VKQVIKSDLIHRRYRLIAIVLVVLVSLSACGRTFLEADRYQKAHLAEWESHARSVATKKLSNFAAEFQGSSLDRQCDSCMYPDSYLEGCPLLATAPVIAVVSGVREVDSQTTCTPTRGGDLDEFCVSARTQKFREIKFIRNSSNSGADASFQSLARFRKMQPNVTTNIDIRDSHAYLVVATHATRVSANILSIQIACPVGDASK